MRDHYKNVTLPSPPLLSADGRLGASHGQAGGEENASWPTKEEMPMSSATDSQSRANRLPIFAAPLLKGFHGAPIELSKGRVTRKLDQPARRNWAKRRAFKD
jgi:hypothetical protein